MTPPPSLCSSLNRTQLFSGTTRCSPSLRLPTRLRLAPMRCPSSARRLSTTTSDSARRQRQCSRRHTHPSGPRAAPPHSLTQPELTHARRTSKGLAERATLVRAWRTPPPPWKLYERAPSTSQLFIGLHLQAQLCLALVDRGPTPESDSAAAWRRLWGARSETRRFKDGAIVNAVVWETSPESKHSVVCHSARYLLHRHLGAAPTSVTCTLNAFDAALSAPACGLSHSSSMLIGQLLASN